MPPPNGKGRAEKAEALLKEAAGVLEPFSVIAGELFARNYNKADPVYTITGMSADGYPVQMSLTFEAFYGARTFLSKLKEYENAGH